GTDESLGTYGLSLYFNSNVTRRLPVYRFPPQHLRVGAKNYTVELRPKRLYKPFSIQLIKFHADTYIGTNKPRNYASDIRLINASTGEDRDLKISMNDPLRYAGETFYQSSFLENRKGTILQVVKNPGWLMPYISCAVVSLGM